MNERGVIYIATGKKHVTEAFKSAVSLKNSTPIISTTLLTNKMPQASCFDNIIIINEPQYSYIDKVQWMYSSPYIQTLYLDTDTYVCYDISELFDLLAVFDIGVVHASNRRSRASQYYMIDGVPRSFTEMNTGVILFRKSPEMERLFSSWLSLYRRDLQRYSEDLKLNDTPLENRMLLPHDQPSFREALYRSELRIATLSPEYNCRFAYPVFASGTIKILHGRHENLSTIAESINKNIKRRVFLLEHGLITR